MSGHHPLYQWIFNSVAERYSRYAAPVFGALATDFVRQLDFYAGETVLDVGTGTGFIAGTVVEQVQHVIGLDFAPDMLRISQAKHPAVQFVQANAHHLPFHDHSFDRIMASFGLSATNPRQSLPEIFRILKPGGWLSFQEWGGYHDLDAVVADVIYDYAVEAEDASPELLALREFLLGEAPWYHDLQTVDDYHSDLTDYGFVVIQAHEYCPLELHIPVNDFIQYKIMWQSRQMELAAMDRFACADCLDQLRRRYYQHTDAAGLLHYDPLIFRIQARKPA